MKKLNIKSIIGTALLAVAAFSTSCESFTDLAPRDSFTDISYWRNTQDLKLYMNGFYGNLPGANAGYDNESDNMITGSFSSWLFNTVTTQNATGSWSWNNIRNLNYFLNRYDQAEGTEAEKNQFAAEARFFRALDYFNKIKTFGDVPWYDRDLTTADRDELFKARDSRDQVVLPNIITDLEYAIQWLPESGSEEQGRLTKEAAQTQLARVCLHYATFYKYHNVSGKLSANDLFKKAADLTKAIIDGGKFTIVKAEDAGCGQSAVVAGDMVGVDNKEVATEAYPLPYKNLFTQYDLSSNKEAILARYYTKEGVDVYHEVGRQEGSNGGFTKDFVECFLMKDGKPIYNDDSGYMGDENIKNEFTNRDPRLYQMVTNAYFVPSRYDAGKKMFTHSNINANGGVTGYAPIKFVSADEKQANAYASDYDWFVYRYAEVLLINAEANAELGTCTQAVLDVTINKLRDRVGMATLTTSPVVDQHRTMDYGYTVADLLYEIRRERRIELAHEGFRYDDLIRWNAMKLLENPRTLFGIRITDEIKNIYNPYRYPVLDKEKDLGIIFTKMGNADEGANDIKYIEITNPYNGATEQYLFRYAKETQATVTNGNVAEGRKWSASDRRFLRPLPTDQLTLNPNLKQNPGWD